MANPWEMYGSPQQTGGNPWEQFKNNPGVPASPVGQQQPQEKGFWESAVNTAKQASVGSYNLETEMTRLGNLKEGTPAYNAQVAKIKGIVGQEQQQNAGANSWGTALGGAVGGLPYGLLDMLTGTGQAEAARALAQGQSETQARQSGAVSTIANILGAGAGNAESRLGTAVKQGIAGTFAGQAPAIAQTGSPDWQQGAQDFALNATLAALLHSNPSHPTTGAADMHPADMFKAQPQEPVSGSLATSDQLYQQQLQQAIAQRAQEAWQQPELFGSYTTTEHIGMERQLQDMQQSGQMPFDFVTPNEIRPTYELAQTPENALRSNMPAAAEQPPLEMTKTSEQNYQAPYKETYGMEPLQDDLFKKGTPVGDAMADQQKLLNGPSGAPLSGSPMDVVGASETHPLANANLDDLISQVRQQNGGIVPDIKGDISKNVMNTANWVRSENNPILTSVISKIDQVKADIKNAVRESWYNEQMVNGRPKFGQGGAADFFKLRPAEQEELLRATAPYWKSGQDIPLEGLGLSEKQMAAWNNLQGAFKDSLDRNNAMRTQLGMEPIAQRNNYMPFLRQGDFMVSASKNGQIAHLEGFSTKREAMRASKELNDSGKYDSVAVNPRGDTAINMSPDIKGQETFSQHQQALSAGRALESSDIPGFMGDRNPKEMADAIRKYFDSEQNNLVGLGLRQIDKQINGKIPPKMYAKVMEYMDKSSGLGFMHEASMMKDIENSIIKASGGLLKPRDIANNIARAYTLFKVQWTPMQTLQALLDPISMAMPHLMSLGKQGVDTGKMGTELSKTVFKLAQGDVTDHEASILSRALRSGYLENVKSLGQLQSDLSKNPSKIREYLKDPFFASKVDAVNRESYFLASYNYARNQMKMNDNAAFHQAGKWVKEAYIGMSPEDKASWIGKAGFASSILGSLSTWNTGMASQFAYMAKLAMKGEDGKKYVLPVLSSLVASTLLGGLRGNGATEDLQKLTDMWNSIFPERAKQGPADFLTELGEKYPKLQPVIHGIPAYSTGLDISTRLGMPSMSSMAPGVSALFGGRAPAPISGLMKAGSAAYDLGKQALNMKSMSPEENEQAIGALLPKFAERWPQDQNVMDRSGKLLTKLTPQESLMSKALSAPTMTEAKAKSQETSLQVKTNQLSSLSTQRTDELSNAMLYGNKDKLNYAITRWADAQQQLAQAGMIKDINEPLNQVIQKAMDRATTPAQRDALKGNITNLLLRSQYGRK
jgi:hypothetical protein